MVFKKIKNKKINSKGQTLVEILLAVGVAVIVITALVVLATSSLRRAQEALRKSESSKLSNAGVETVLYYKNIEGFENLAPDDESCYRMESSGEGTVLTVIGSCHAIPSESNFDNPGNSWEELTSLSGLDYKRQIKITRTSDGQLNVTSTVIWRDTQGVRVATVPRVITNWKND